MQRVLVTGANGNLGRALLRALAARPDAPRLRAAVRSSRAAGQLAQLASEAGVEIRLVDYGDETAIEDAVRDCAGIVHLVGILKENRHSRYDEAHEHSCSVLSRAAAKAGVQHIVYLGILGSHPDSPNPCLASKGRAERILLSSGVPTTVLRVPMVLGRGDHASRALGSQARARLVWLVGGGRTRQQPIDARDVVRGIAAALGLEPRAGAGAPGGSAALDLAGPESLAHRELVARAARVLGRTPPVVLPIPLPFARFAAAIAARLLPDPPITPAMLDVLQHDDDVDPRPACEQLGIELTPLDATLAWCLASATEQAGNDPAAEGGGTR